MLSEHLRRVNLGVLAVQSRKDISVSNNWAIVEYSENRRLADKVIAEEQSRLDKEHSHGYNALKSTDETSKSTSQLVS
jgi:hypothetical protein